ncbi:uncharacterized protein LOC111692774, partial [Anoplophora glabripennis]|uniref:uncharacterized protein LOC111692774 n=1 Tax=Anoplophora glabripennis TaxID=217634 RepID=UPI000C793AEF
IITVLSVLSNWESLRKPIRNTDYNKLKCLQGFRILTMWLVVGGHSIIIAGTTYVANTKIIDYFLLNLFGRCLINFSLLLIQSNFLMSGWLRTIQIYNDVEKSDDKKLSVNMITKTLTARYLR